MEHNHIKVPVSLRMFVGTAFIIIHMKLLMSSSHLVPTILTSD
jgi:hypothetical protein